MRKKRLSRSGSSATRFIVEKLEEFLGGGELSNPISETESALLTNAAQVPLILWIHCSLHCGQNRTSRIILSAPKTIILVLLMPEYRSHWTHSSSPPPLHRPTGDKSAV